MKKNKRKVLSSVQRVELLKILKERFEENMNRHVDIEWKNVEEKLVNDTEKLWSLNEMERTGGEPDVIGYDIQTGKYIFCDCSIEVPACRSKLCYDSEVKLTVDVQKPHNNAVDMAKEMGVELLTDKEYHQLQKLGNFDTQTSSWLKTPEKIRKLGGAFFANLRYGIGLAYHNGSGSYYDVKGFRGALKI